MTELNLVIDSNNVIELTFLQALSYLEEAEKLIKTSAINLFNDEEDLDEFRLFKKYNEKNRRLTQLGQACEYFLKTILLLESSVEAKNDGLSLSVEQLWDKKMRGHKIELLFDKIDQKNKEFKNIFSRCAFSDDKFLTGQYIFDILTKNSDVYEASRYNMQRKTTYNLQEVLLLTKQISICALMFFNRYKGNIKISDLYESTSNIISDLQQEMLFLGFDDIETKKIINFLNRLKLKDYSFDSVSLLYNHYESLLFDCNLTAVEIKSILSVGNSLITTNQSLSEKVNYLIDNNLRFLLLKSPTIIMFNLSYLKAKIYFLSLIGVEINEDNYNLLFESKSSFCHRHNVSLVDFDTKMEEFESGKSSNSRKSNI